MTLEAMLFDATHTPEPADKLASHWAAWFDVLREVTAAAHGVHPLRLEDLFEKGVK